MCVRCIVLGKTSTRICSVSSGCDEPLEEERKETLRPIFMRVVAEFVCAPLAARRRHGELIAVDADAGWNAVGES